MATARTAPCFGFRKLAIKKGGMLLALLNAQLICQFGNGVPCTSKATRWRLEASEIPEGSPAGTGWTLSGGKVRWTYP